MTKEVQLGICIALIVLSLVALIAGEGIFHGLYVFFGFGTIGALYIVFIYATEG